MDSTETLITILSIVLIVLLLLLIVAVIFIIRLLRQVQRISVTASNVMEDVKSASSVFKKSAAPVAASRIISNVLDMWRDSSKKSKE